jgi:hypothetical protein
MTGAMTSADQAQNPAPASTSGSVNSSLSPVSLSFRNQNLRKPGRRRAALDRGSDRTRSRDEPALAFAAARQTYAPFIFCDAAIRHPEIHRVDGRTDAPLITASARVPKSASRFRRPWLTGENEQSAKDKSPSFRKLHEFPKTNSFDMPTAGL